MKTAVILISFGEPTEPTLEQVSSFLERIFLQNASLDGGDGEARLRRSPELARARAPGLVQEYERIGGSPLNAQAEAQAAALESELERRGKQIRVFSAYQYTDPSIGDVVQRAHADGCVRIVALPTYPLCGYSTTVMALDDARAAVDGLPASDLELLEVSGWHLHPEFFRMWADQALPFLRERNVDLNHYGTELLFSIHGTPVRYLEAGNRYDRYAEETCEGIAQLLGAPHYHLGFQNHGNRPIDWTPPEVDEVVQSLGGRGERLVVLPAAFLHEQSETLAELDRDLREVAEGAGLEYHRVPVPHNSPYLAKILADLVEARLSAQPSAGVVDYRRCLCRAGGASMCTNGLRRAQRTNM